MKKRMMILCALLLLGLAGCQGQEPGADSQNVQMMQQDAAGGPAEQALQSQPAQIQKQEAAAPSVTLYIGMGDQFQTYEEAYQGELNDQGMVPAEGVVAEMARLTGWNLDLAGEITTGKDGLTVSFGEDCALFSGPPREQKEEFRVYDSYQLDQTILDSVKMTLQHWAVVPGQGDPDSVNVYYCGPDGKDLVLINSGWTISSLQPYEQFPHGN